LLKNIQNRILRSSSKVNAFSFNLLPQEKAKEVVPKTFWFLRGLKIHFKGKSFKTKLQKFVVRFRLTVFLIFLR
jgi:hypothetical protein